MSYLKKYFKKVPEDERSPAAISYMGALDSIAFVDPQIAETIVNELTSQRTHLKLIASENYSSLPVQLAMGNLLTDKYCEGYVGFTQDVRTLTLLKGKQMSLQKSCLMLSMPMYSPIPVQMQILWLFGQSWSRKYSLLK